MATAAAKKPRKSEHNYVCSFCNKTFLREAAFLDHVCTQMQRTQKMKTAEGLAGWLAYSTWIKTMGKKVPPQSGFISSQFYQSFIKFAEFTRAVKTIDVEQYVRHMVKHNIPPVIWTHDAIYSEWIRANSVEKSPLKIVQQTTLFLMSYCDSEGVDISDLFTRVNSPQLVDWIRLGNVTPWLLFTSTKFKEWYATLDADDKQQFGSVVSIAEWGDKLRSNPNTVQKIKEIVSELGL